MLQAGRGLSSSSGLIKISECDVLLFGAITDQGEAEKELGPSFKRAVSFHIFLLFFSGVKS
ncbi:hypothetical protein [Bartonella tribocorum]|uniref:Uncharacterized protein n=1 Tax=Bartonella tribocorum TaxID=85701 RepID=A0A2N9Y8X2_9HYPH|nr:hypothetical protein [Bartonella tribocorum]PIT68155.1 hypothetical protein CER18_08050 [Bartonella tribocorum]